MATKDKGMDWLGEGIEEEWYKLAASKHHVYLTQQQDSPKGN